MATKNLDAYKLGVVLDASGAAKGISALADADKQATKLDASFDRLGKSAVRGFDDVKKAAVNNSQKTQQALASALLAGKKNVGGLITEARKAQAEFRALEKAEEKALRLATGGFLSRVSARAGSIIPGLSHISNIIQGLPQIGQLAGALVSPFKDLAEEGLEFNMLIEEAQVGFEGITGGIKQASKYTKELTDFAAANPIFNTQGTVRAAQQMAIFGFETHKTTDYLKVWGGALAKGGKFSDENLQSIVRGFGQIRQLGTVSAEDMNILQDANIPAWELLAKAIGKTTAETRKLAEARKLNGPAAVDAITAMLDSDPRFAGGADAYGKILRGRLAQVQDLREVAAGQAMSGTTKELTAVLGQVMTGDIPSLVNKMAAGFDTALTPVAKIMGASVRGIIGGSITAGLAEGIDATKGVALQSMSSMGLDTIKMLMKIFDINSPSGVTAEIGAGLVEGLAYGKHGKGGLASEESKQKLRKALEELATDPRVRAWFEVIRQVEGGKPDVMAGGRTVKSGPRHPGQIVPRSEWYRGQKGPSSAAGNWQITLTNWRKWAPILGLDNWSDPDQQMMVALALFAEGGGDVSLLKGDMKGALKASSPWAATPLSHLPGGKPLTSQKFVERYQGLVNGGAGVAGAGAAPVPVRIVAADPSVLKSDFGLQDSTPLARTVASLDTPVEEVKVGLTDLATMLPAAATNTGYGLLFLESNARTAGQRMEVAAGSFAKSVIGSASKIDSLMGAFGQVAGMMPGGQQVGKKRGFFSKMLGFAAPFLSFLPGGQILSALAGIGSSALGGDYAGALMGAATGFSTGGAFRSRGTGSTSSATSSVNVGAGLEPRAMGGPVRRGRAYVVGDRGPRHAWEVFEPEENGYVHASVDAYERSRGAAQGGGRSGHGLTGSLLARLLDQLDQHGAAVTQLHQKIGSMPADHVVSVGARGAQRAIADAYMSQASRDPKVVEWMQRRTAA